MNTDVVCLATDWIAFTTSLVGAAMHPTRTLERQTQDPNNQNLS